MISNFLELGVLPNHIQSGQRHLKYACVPLTGIHHHVLHEHHPQNDSFREINQRLFSRIATDLEQWSDGISLEMVERTYCTVRPQ